MVLQWLTWMRTYSKWLDSTNITFSLSLIWIKIVFVYDDHKNDPPLVISRCCTLFPPTFCAFIHSANLFPSYHVCDTAMSKTNRKPLAFWNLRSRRWILSCSFNLSQTTGLLTPRLKRSQFPPINRTNHCMSFFSFNNLKQFILKPSSYSLQISFSFS